MLVKCLHSCESRRASLGEPMALLHCQHPGVRRVQETPQKVALVQLGFEKRMLGDRGECDGNQVRERDSLAKAKRDFGERERLDFALA